MQAAQRLFQDGHISYHRTDSTTLSDEGARRVGARDPRDVRRRVLRRPAPLRDQGEERAGSARGDPPDRIHAAPPPRSKARSIGDDLRVYELIWKRTMASQMVDARVLRTTVEISGAADDGEHGGVHRVAARRSSSPASGAPTSRAATIRRRSSKSRRRCCRSSRSASAIDRARRDTRALLTGARAEAARNRRRRRDTPKRR